MLSKIIWLIIALIIVVAIALYAIQNVNKKSFINEPSATYKVGKDVPDLTQEQKDFIRKYEGK